MPDVAKLENSMFFVKALPLSPEMDIDAMTNNMQAVFNTYNINILFTTHHLPCKVNQSHFNPQQMQQMQQRQMQLVQQQQQQMQQQQMMMGGAPGGSQVVPDNQGWIGRRWIQSWMTRKYQRSFQDWGRNPKVRSLQKLTQVSSVITTMTPLWTLNHKTWFRTRGMGRSCSHRWAREGLLLLLTSKEMRAATSRCLMMRCEKWRLAPQEGSETTLWYLFLNEYLKLIS